MADISVTIKPKIPSKAYITKQIVDALKEEVNRVLYKSSSNITERVRALVLENILASPTTKSLLGSGADDLQAQLGIEHPKEVLTAIIETFVDSVTVEIKPIKVLIPESGAVMTVSFIDATYDDVLRLPESSYYSTNKRGQTFLIPWLEWLLTSGSVVVKDYYIKWGNFLSPVPSRTGRAVMVNKLGRTWRLPSSHRGAKDNNFITRALEEIEDELAGIIEKEILNSI